MLQNGCWRREPGRAEGEMRPRQVQTESGAATGIRGLPGFRVNLGKPEPRSSQGSPSPYLRLLEINRRNLNRYGNTLSVIGLPRDLTLHWRGIWHTSEGRVFGRFDDRDVVLQERAYDRRQPPKLSGDSWILCHNKPIRCTSVARGDEARFPDIPDRLDLFFLLVSQFESIAFVGLRTAAVISRCHHTDGAMARLADWLRDPDRGKYRQSRGRAQLKRRRRCVPPDRDVYRQFARSALRAAGLRWPGKPRDREREWPDCLKELGLSVEQTDAPPFSPRRIR